MYLKWYVYRFNINAKIIQVVNVFEHDGFRKSVEDLIDKYEDKSEFEYELKSNLRYYFWCRSEHEVIICPWVGGDQEKINKKVDVYDQINNNWDIFLDYVWNNRPLRIRRDMERGDSDVF